MRTFKSSTLIDELFREKGQKKLKNSKFLLYHGAPYTKLSSIREHGLLPTPNVIWVTDIKELAAIYSVWKDVPGVVIEIDATTLIDKYQRVKGLLDYREGVIREPIAPQLLKREWVIIPDENRERCVETLYGLKRTKQLEECLVIAREWFKEQISL